MCLLGENESEALDDDGVDVTWSEPPGLGSIPYETIVIKAWSESPGLGLIPSEPRLSTSTVLDFDNDDGTFEIPSEPPGLHATWSEPPRLGLIPSEPCLYDDDDNRIFDIMSEPPGLGYALIVLDLVEKDGIDESSSEPLGLGLIPSEPRLCEDDDDGIFEITSEPREQIKKMADDHFERGRCLP